MRGYSSKKMLKKTLILFFFPGRESPTIARKGTQYKYTELERKCPRTSSHSDSIKVGALKLRNWKTYPVHFLIIHSTM